MSAARSCARIGLATLLALLLAEGVTRAWITSPSGQAPDPHLGWIWRAGAQVYNHNEGFARHQVSPEGLLDAPLALKGERRRIVGLGNSFLEALQVPQDTNYTARVERALPGIDYLNAGRSGLGAPHYPRVMERLLAVAPGLAADLLVVHLGEGDGVHLLNAQVIDGLPRPPPDGADPWKARLEPLLRRSALLTALSRRFKPLVGRWLGAEEAPPVREEGAEAEQTARLTAILRALGAHAPVWVLYTPHLRFLPGGRTEDAAAHEARVYRAAAAAAGARFIDAGPALRASYAATGQPPVGFANHRIGLGHLNAAGHAAVAEALVPALRTWLESAR